MRYYRDNETMEVISELDLELEFDELKRETPDEYDCTFREFLRDCMQDHNGTLQFIGHKSNYKAELTEYILGNPMWLDYYNKHKRETTAPFANVVTVVVDYMFDSYCDPYTKPYPNRNWLMVASNVYLDLDAVWEFFEEEVMAE